MTNVRTRGCAAALVLILAACGGDSDDAADDLSATADDVAEDLGDAAEDLASATSPEELEEAVDDLEQAAEDMVDDLEAQQSGGSATITVGDQTWTFDGALCAVGEEETGQEGAEFVFSSIADGLQFYVSIDEFGHSVSIHDVENFEDPSVSWDSDMNAGEFIVVDGKNVTGSVDFVDYENESFDGVAGSFEATCP